MLFLKEAVCHPENSDGDFDLLLALADEDEATGSPAKGEVDGAAPGGHISASDGEESGEDDALASLAEEAAELETKANARGLPGPHRSAFCKHSWQSFAGLLC